MSKDWYEEYARSRARFAASDQPTLWPTVFSERFKGLMVVSVIAGVIFWMLGAH